MAKKTYCPFCNHWWPVSRERPDDVNEGVEARVYYCNHCVKLFCIEKLPPFKIYQYVPSGTGSDKKDYIGRLPP